MKLTKSLATDITVASNNKAMMVNRSPGFLRVAYQLEEAGPPNVHSRVILAIIGLCLLAVFVAIAFRVETVSNVSGRLDPKENTFSVESLAGGLIDQLVVSNGQKVNKGQLLAVIISPNISGEIAVTKKLIDGLRARIQLRLAHFDEIIASNSAETGVDLWDAHLAILALRKETLNAYTGTLLVEEENARDRQTNLATQRQFLVDQMEAAERIQSIYQRLLQNKLIPETKVIEVESDVVELKRSIEQLDAESSEQEYLIGQLNAQAQEFRAEFREQQLRELEPLLNQLVEAEAVLDSLTERTKLNQPRAPFEGVVFQISKSVGNVLQPGQAFAQLLPENSDIIAKLRALPRDITRLEIGQKARLSIDGVSTHNAGYLDGDVNYISPTSIEAEDGEHYFEVHVSLEEIESYPQAIVAAIRAGAKVQGAIITGDKTLAEYLGKPISRGFQFAFGEP